MRKELLVFVDTMERGEEISVSSVTKDRSYVIISTPTGKVSASKDQLRKALDELDSFYSSEDSSSVPVVEQSSFMEVSYGDEES